LWNVHFKKPGTTTPHITNPPTEPPPLTCQSFTGLRIQQLVGYVHHDSPRLMDSLQELFGRVPPTARAKVDASVSLPKDALGLLRAEPSESNPLLHDQERASYWSLQGMAGFIAGKWRPDAQLGFIAIAQQFAVNFTAYTRDCVVQLAAYLLGSPELTLTFRPSPGTPGPMRALAIGHWSGSSALNVGAGLSWGGGCSGVRGSGLISWKSFAPKKPADSSGAAELIAATFTNKFGQGTRMFVKECCMGALISWAFDIEASPALAGVEMDLVSDRMRYVAARYAMLRYSEEVTADIKL
jgi:hypothetical protein